MPLSDTGDRMTDTDFNLRAKATGIDNETVIVVASSEAVEDFGWPTVFSAASTKYDAGEFEIVGDVRQVRVVSVDCNT